MVKIRTCSDHIMGALVNLVALWNLLVGVGSVVRLDCDLWLLGTVAILALGTVDLLVERWSTVLDYAIEFHIDSEAHQGCSDSLVEEANEQFGSDQGVNNDEDHRNPNGWELIGILGSVSENQVACTSVEGSNGEHTNKDEHSSQNISEVELDKMLQVEDEATPGTLAVWVSRNSHECIGHQVQVLNQILEASNEASQKAANENNQSIVSVILFRGVGNGIDKHSQHEHDSMKERAQSDWAGVFEVGDHHTSNDTWRSSLFSVGWEVELSSRDHVNEFGLFADEWDDPNNAEEHGNGQTCGQIGPIEVLVVLARVFILYNCDFTHWHNTNETEAPEENGKEAEQEVVNGNESESLSCNHEVSGRVNDCNGNLHLRPVAPQHAVEDQEDKGSNTSSNKESSSCIGNLGSTIDVSTNSGQQHELNETNGGVSEQLSAVSHQVQVDEGVNEGETEGNKDGNLGDGHVLPELAHGLVCHDFVPLGLGCSTEFFRVFWHAKVQDIFGCVSLTWLDYAALFGGWEALIIVKLEVIRIRAYTSADSSEVNCITILF